MPSGNVSAYRYVVAALVVWVIATLVPVGRQPDWLVDRDEDVGEASIKQTTWMLLGAIASASSDGLDADREYLLGLIVVAVTLEIACVLRVPFLGVFVGTTALAQTFAPSLLRPIASLMPFFYFAMYYRDTRCRWKEAFDHVLFGCVGIGVGMVSKAALGYADRKSAART